MLTWDPLAAAFATGCDCHGAHPGCWQSSQWRRPSRSAGQGGRCCGRKVQPRNSANERPPAGACSSSRAHRVVQVIERVAVKLTSNWMPASLPLTPGFPQRPKDWCWSSTSSPFSRFRPRFSSSIPSFPHGPSHRSRCSQRRKPTNSSDTRSRQSADAYRRLARSLDRAVRAAALVRLARVLRQMDRGDAALEVYREMAELEDVQIVGTPAALIALDAEMRLLEQLGRTDEAKLIARVLQQHLAAGRWRVTSGQYEHYASEAARISGRQIPHDHRLPVAHAVADFWKSWRAEPTPRGRMLVGPLGGRHLVAWRSGSGVSAAWLTPLEQLLHGRPRRNAAGHFSHRRERCFNWFPRPGANRCRSNKQRNRPALQRPGD